MKPITKALVKEPMHLNLSNLEGCFMLSNPNNHKFGLVEEVPDYIVDGYK